MTRRIICTIKPDALLRGYPEFWRKELNLHLVKIAGGIFINYLASFCLALFFFVHVTDKAQECAAILKYADWPYTVRFNRSFGLIAWLACILPGYSTMPVDFWWYYFAPITVILIILADIWLTKLEDTAGYYRYILLMFGGLYTASMLISLTAIIWRFT